MIGKLNQAITCNNPPPSIALGTPPPLRRLPLEVDVDAWLHHYHRRSFRCKVRASGSVVVDRDSYYIGRQYQGQTALVILDAEQRHLEFYVQNQLVKTKPIKNLYQGSVDLADFVAVMLQAAESETRRLAYQHRLSHRVA